MNNNEINRLKNWCSKTFFEPNDLSIDSFDFDAEIDRKITYEENKTLLRGKLITFLKDRVNKADIKTQQDRAEYELLEDFKVSEEQAQRKLELEIKELKTEKQAITDKYFIPTEYIKSVAKGYHKAFIFLGEAGIGKSYITRQVLAKIGINFIESRGVNSPLALYKFLYDNNSKDTIIVFDDVAQLVNNENAYSILLGVLWEGLAQWNSTTEKLKIPKQFIFNGRIIIIANKLSSFNADVIKSRCLVYNLIMNREDKLKMMYEIAKQPHNNLESLERFKIVDFIKENTNNSTTNLDLRTQHKAEQLYLYSPDNWKKLVLALLEHKRELEIMEYALKNSNTIREAEKIFVSETGLSRRTFYTLKKEVLGYTQELKGGLT